MSTYFQSKEEASVASKWVVVNAAGVPLGRLASEVAALIRGKHRPEFTRHTDGGDFVIVVNAGQVVLTGKKRSLKIYYHHTGYPGGLKEIKAETMLSKHPDRVIKGAVQGMLPKGALGHRMINKLKVYAGAGHPHSAQMPEAYELKYCKANSQ